MATYSLDLESSSSQYASISNASAPNLDISGAQTWEAWIKPESLAANMSIFGSLDSTAATGIQLYIGTSGQMIINLRGVTITSGTTSNGFVTVGVWQHVGFKWNGTNEVTIWSNDQIHTSATSGSLTAHSNSFAIGRPGDYVGNYYDGLIRNARVWNVARTQAEIRANMNVDTPTGTGLQGNWILENNYTDSSANGYTLTASGSPTFVTQIPDAIALVENKTFTKKHKISVQSSQISGSSDLTDVPVVFTENNFLSEVFTNTQGQEINTNSLLNDSSLKAYYRFNTGALTTDSKGSNTLTNNNTVGEATGKFGIGADAGSSNTNKYLSIASDLGINGDSAITMSFWFKLNTEIASSQYGIIVHGSTTTASRRLQLYYEFNGGTRRLVLENAGTTGTYNIALGASDWYQMTVVRNSGASGTATLYINGIQVISSVAKGTTSPSTAKFFLFTDNSATIFSSAIIDDVAVFDRALSTEEIRSLYAGGQDLRFSTDIDGKTRLAHEVVSWDTVNKTGEVWVKANTLFKSSNTDVYVHYGNSTASALDENEAFGKHQVWSSSWKGVYHLGNTIDSTNNSHDLTASNSPSTVTGKTGNAVDLGSANTNKKLETTDTLDIDGGNITILGWYRLNAEISSGDWNFVKQGNNTSDVGYNFVYQYNSGTRRFVFARNRYFVAANIFSYNTTLGTTNFNHLVLRYNGTTLEGFMNASSIGTVASSGNGAGDDYQGFVIGSGGTSAYASIDSDDVMVYNGALSDDFITTLYNNQNSPATFAIPVSLLGGSFLLNFI